MRAILVPECDAIVEVQVGDLGDRVDRRPDNRVGRARRVDDAAAARVGVGQPELVVLAEALLDTRLQTVVIEPAKVDELEHLAGRAESRIEARDRRRARRRRTQALIEILQHVEIAVAGVDVIRAQGNAARQLFFRADARLVRVRQVAVRFVEPDCETLRDPFNGAMGLGRILNASAK